MYNCNLWSRELNVGKFLFGARAKLEIWPYSAFSLTYIIGDSYFFATFFPFFFNFIDLLVFF